MKTVPFNVSNETTQSYITRVYAWMFLALLITAIVSGLTISSERAMTLIYGNPAVLIVLLISELLAVWVLASRIETMAPQTARFLFVIYSVLNGITLSWIFVTYTERSITSTFFISAVMFGVMSFYGYVTNRDLTSAGNILTMALVGIILASIVNIFFKNPAIYWITNIVGVIVFVGLIAFDTQKIRKLADDKFFYNGNSAIIGALALYLDLVNLFLLLLRMFGKRRNDW